MDIRNKISSNGQPDVRGPLDYTGKNSLYKGYPIFPCPFTCLPNTDKHKLLVGSIQNIIIKYKQINEKKNIYIFKEETIEWYDNDSSMIDKDSQRNTRIAQINMEGLTRSKTEILNKMIKGADILKLQEIHILEEEAKWLMIPGFYMINYIGDNKHDIATYLN